MSSSQITNETVPNISSSLQTLLHNLQTESSLFSSKNQTTPTTPSFYAFFLTPLPLLLTPRKAHAIYNLRIAYIHVTHLSSFAEEAVKTRYVNFGRALLWALDHAEHLIQSGPEACQVEIMKAIRTIFQLVASLCHREWGIHQPLTIHNHQLDHATPYGAVPSTEDPVYQAPRKMTSRPATNSSVVGIATQNNNQVSQILLNLLPDDHIPSLDTSYHALSDETKIPQDQIDLNGSSLDHDFHTSKNISNTYENNAMQQKNNTNHSTLPSNHIHNIEKLISPGACITETADGCHFPFELFVVENHKDDICGSFGLFNVRVSCPDNTHFPYIPVQDVRVLRRRITNSTTKGDKLEVIIDMSSKTLETIIDRLKLACMAKFPSSCHTFLICDDVKLLTLDTRVKIEIPVLSDCFVSVVCMLWCVKHSLFEALDLSQHDIMGCGLLQAAFEESLEGTRMVLSLAGLIVEENRSNLGEEIISKLLSSGVVSEL